MTSGMYCDHRGQPCPKNGECDCAQPVSHPYELEYYCESTPTLPEGPVNLKVGDRVRFMVSMPEDGIVAGETTGLVSSIEVRDDVTYRIAPDDSKWRIALDSTELWKITPA